MSVLVIKIDADLYAVADEDLLRRVEKVFVELMVQIPFEIHNLACHAGLDTFLTSKPRKTVVESLQWPDKALQEEYDPSPRQIMRNDLVN